MLDTLEGAFKESARYPDIVLSGHVHNYQRYTRQIGGRDLPFIVAGGGGYFNIYKMQSNPDGSPLEVPMRMAEPGLTLENYWTDSHGYMKMRFERGKLIGEYYAVAEANQSNPGQATPVDSFAVDLRQHKLVASKRRP